MISQASEVASLRDAVAKLERSRCASRRKGSVAMANFDTIGLVGLMMSSVSLLMCFRAAILSLAR